MQAARRILVLLWSRLWNPARIHEHTRLVREEAMRKGTQFTCFTSTSTKVQKMLTAEEVGSPHLTGELYHRARLFKRMHLLVASGHADTPLPEIEHLSARERRKAVERAWEVLSLLAMLVQKYKY